MQQDSTNENDGSPNEIVEMQQCIGPTCTYDASTPRSATGFTWRSLQEFREANIRERYALKGIFELTPEMLLDRPVPTYDQYKKITSKPVKR